LKETRSDFWALRLDDHSTCHGVPPFDPAVADWFAGRLGVNLKTWHGSRGATHCTRLSLGALRWLAGKSWIDLRGPAVREALVNDLSATMTYTYASRALSTKFCRASPFLIEVALRADAARPSGSPPIDPYALRELDESLRAARDRVLLLRELADFSADDFDEAVVAESERMMRNSDSPEMRVFKQECARASRVAKTLIFGA
jgi:hypothetical protein